jgi:hypothetical protein
MSAILGEYSPAGQGCTRHFSVPPLEYKNSTSYKKYRPNFGLNIQESYGKRPTSHQLQSPGSNPLGVGQGGNAAEGYVAKQHYAAKEDTKVNRSLSAAEGYVAKYAAKEDTKMNRSLSGGEMLN